MKDNTLPKLLRASARKFGGKIALREKDLGIWQNITWKEYFERAKFFGLGLLRLGFEREDKVSILSENNPEWLYGDLGTQAVGGIVVGICRRHLSDERGFAGRIYHESFSIEVCNRGGSGADG